MRILVRLGVGLGIMFGVATIGAQSGLPRVFLTDPGVLAAQRAKPDPELLRLAKAAADKALTVPVQSVVHKTQVAPSGDKHDYLSMGDYWWPNPATKDHLPYIRRDGEHNPETYTISDKNELNKMAEATRALALGWYLTGDARYAEHAALLLRAWFLAPETAMRPNLDYAQYIPGVNTGRGIGIIDVRYLPRAIDAAGMLAGSKSWTAEDEAGLKAWFGEYLKWLMTAAEAKKEALEPNNHGTWFAEQMAPIAMYEGKTEEARRVGEQVRTERIPAQIDEKGWQKLELVRTNSFSYSAMNLEGLTQLAITVKPLGVDLYKPGSPGILTAVEAMMPFDPGHKWPYEQIGGMNPDSLCEVLARAEGETREVKFGEARGRFGCKADAFSAMDAMGR